MRITCIGLLALLLAACGQEESSVDADESSAQSSAQEKEADDRLRASPTRSEQEAVQLRRGELFARLPLPPDLEHEEDLSAHDEFPLVLDGATEMSREELLAWALDALPAAGFAITDVGDVRVTGAQTLGMIGHGYQGTAYLADGEFGYRFEKTQEPMPPPLEVIVEPQIDEASAADDQ